MHIVMAVGTGFIAHAAVYCGAGLGSRYRAYRHGA
jgi:hypothetical protein